MREFATFERWAAGHGLPSLPTSAAIIATNVGAMARGSASLKPRGLAGVRLALAAIAFRHRHARHDLDLRSPDVKTAMKGLKGKRAKEGRKVDRAEPVTVDMFRKLASLVDADNPADARDLAMIALGIVRALRGHQSYSVSISTSLDLRVLGAIAFEEDGGAVFHLSRTKTSRASACGSSRAWRSMLSGVGSRSARSRWAPRCGGRSGKET